MSNIRELTMDELDFVTGGTGNGPPECTPGKGPKDKDECHPGKGPKDKDECHPGKGPKDKCDDHC